MPREIEVAYPCLVRQWRASGGHVIRLRPPGARGIPDFLLVHKDCGNVMCEVKSVSNMSDAIGLDILQAEVMDKIYTHGGHACVMALCLMCMTWSGFAAGMLEDTVRKRPRELNWNQGQQSLAVTLEFLRGLL